MPVCHRRSPTTEDVPKVSKEHRDESRLGNMPQGYIAYLAVSWMLLSRLSDNHYGDLCLQRATSDSEWRRMSSENTEHTKNDHTVMM